MGYRTTFVTEDIYFPLPDWFVEKWPTIHYGEHEGKPGFPLSSRFERKFYDGVQDELFLDLARVIRENTETYPKNATLVLLHEDGEVDRVHITGRKITLEGSLKYDPDDDENWQFGTREKEYVIEEKDSE